MGAAGQPTSTSQNATSREFCFRPGTERICHGVHLLLIATVLVIGLSNLFAWLLDLDRFQGLTLMRFNTALALSLGGLSLWCWREGASNFRRTLAISSGLVVALIGGLTALQFPTGWDLHIDQLFLKQVGDAGGVYTSHVGRMSLNAALTFLFAGLGLALLESHIRLGRFDLALAPGFAILGLLPALAALVGHAIGLGYFTGLLGSTNILFHTVIAQIAVCAAIMTARPERAPLRLLLADDAGGVLLRWLGPGTVGVLLALGWVVHRGELYGWYKAHEALAIVIFGGLIILGGFLLGAASALSRTERGRRSAEAALRQQKEAAEHANKSKDEFLAALSHELRTPLAPVLMAAEEMYRNETLPREIRERLEMVRRNVRLESRLIDDLLDLTGIVRGQLGLQYAPCDLAATLREAIEIVREDAALRGLKLADEIDAAPGWIEGDGTRLKQVFWNLLRNAVKFTPPGGRITVTTRQEPEAQRWILEVTDTGIGIAAEVLPVLFAKFERGERSGDHRFGGLGLGLAISKAIVDLHGGAIGARSDGPGRGATFSVELGPLTSPPSQVPASAAGEIKATEIPPLRLLLVEDHAATAEVMTRLLRERGHTVVAARSVGEAIAAAGGNGNFDAVICDLGLPDGSGHELMALLRARYQLRGIAVSGYGMDEDIRRSEAAGFAAHLTKPVEYPELHEALQHVLGLSEK